MKFCLGTLEKIGRLEKGRWEVHIDDNWYEIESYRRIDGHHFILHVIHPNLGKTMTQASHMTRARRIPGYRMTCDEEAPLLWAGAVR